MVITKYNPSIVSYVFPNFFSLLIHIFLKRFPESSQKEIQTPHESAILKEKQYTLDICIYTHIYVIIFEGVSNRTDIYNCVPIEL
jgi:hypothetical protein